MRVSVALLVACLVVVGHVAARHQKREIQSCQADSQCGGRYCFCLKPEHHHYGTCICNMDPDAMKPHRTDDLACFKHEDCKGRGPPHHYCYCNQPKDQYFGSCECIAPLLG